MANPTTNYGWQMPTSTDLVTDLPADFEVFGQAVDTALIDLKGGTTGQVLSKTTGTVMDFTWVTSNPGDITGVAAGTGISGGGTSGDVTVTNSMATTIDAKGDLIGGTADNAFARLAVGANNTLLTADSTTATGLKWASSAATFATGSNFVATMETTTSAAFVGLTTAQAVTVTTGTKALVFLRAQFDNAATASANGLMSFAISGATTRAASSEFAGGVQFLATSSNTQLIIGAPILVTGLTAGSNVFTAQFNASQSTIAYFRNRTISVIDLGS